MEEIKNFMGEMLEVAKEIKYLREDIDAMSVKKARWVSDKKLRSYVR